MSGKSGTYNRNVVIYSLHELEDTLLAHLGISVL